MTITEAIKQSASGSIRRLSWPAGLQVEPTDTPECCWLHTKERTAPRWEPQKEDLIADDWEPVPVGISVNEQRKQNGLPQIDEPAFGAKYVISISETKEIRETRSCEELNDLVKSGWMLLCAVESSQGWLFSLGRVK